MNPPVYPNRARLLRERLLSQHAPPPEPVTIDGEQFWVATPTIEMQTAIMKLASIDAAKLAKKGAMADVETDRLMAAAALRLAVDETGAAVFEPADFDAIRQAPTTSTIARLARACLRKLNGKSAVEVEAADEVEPGEG